MSVPMAAVHYKNSEAARVRNIGSSAQESGSAGVRGRLKMTIPSWLALPSMLLSNVRSPNDKLDYINKQHTPRSKTVVFLSSWRHGSTTVLNFAIQLNGRTVFTEQQESSGMAPGDKVVIWSHPCPPGLL